MGRTIVGGVFELSESHPPDHRSISRFAPRKEGSWHVSGRSALVHILSHARGLGINHIQLPAYLCSSILDAVHAAGLDYSFYMVRSDLSIDLDPRPRAAILVIHYFGWENTGSRPLRDETDSTQLLIEDASQSSLSPWIEQVDSRSILLTNPRKLGPIPVGAWCSLPGDLPLPGDSLLRLIDSALAAARDKFVYLNEPTAERDLVRETAFVRAFHQLESQLAADLRPLALPSQYLYLLSQVAWGVAAQARRQNWKTLDRHLPPNVRRVAPHLDPGTVPIGLPIRIRHRDEVQAELASQGFLCPVHWKLPTEITARRFPSAVTLANEMLTLPIDQRYDTPMIREFAHAFGQGFS